MSTAYTSISIVLPEDDHYPDVSIYKDQSPILSIYLGTVRVSLTTKGPVTKSQVEVAKRLANAAGRYADELAKWVDSEPENTVKISAVGES